MKSFSRQFGGMPKVLEESRQFLGEVIADIGWQDREIDLQLAIGEVMQNVIRYGFEGGRADGEITMALSFDGTLLTCNVSDNAPPSNPDEWMLNAEKRRPDEGGYGLSIIDAIADSYEVFPGEDGNTSKIVFSKQGKEG